MMGCFGILDKNMVVTSVLGSPHILVDRRVYYMLSWVIQPTRGKVILFVVFGLDLINSFIYHASITRTRVYMQ